MTYSHYKASVISYSSCSLSISTYLNDFKAHVKLQKSTLTQLDFRFYHSMFLLSVFFLWAIILWTLCISLFITLGAFIVVQHSASEGFKIVLVVLGLVQTVLILDDALPMTTDQDVHYSASEGFRIVLVLVLLCPDCIDHWLMHSRWQYTDQDVQ